MVENGCGANVGVWGVGGLSLLGCLCSLQCVRCVAFLCAINQTVADHDTLGRGPQHNMRSVLFSPGGMEGIIIFLERHENISLPLATSIWYNTGAVDSISSLYLLLSQCGEASQDLPELWLFV